MLSITTKSSIPRLSPIVICVGLALMQGTSSYANEGADLAAANNDGETKEEAREKREDSAAVMKSVIVTGQHEHRDERGRDEVFEKDVVNVYQGKEEIERYKVHSVGDLFNGLNGVYSGDSRNSGALDPNIRGLQGGGRIPVTIDGTEQATSVWLGPAGVANRNYLDPNLVGSVMAEKGPSMTPGVSSGIGGSIQVRTLEPDDIVRPGETFGIEIKASTASNSVKPNEGSFSNFGKDYRDIPGAYSTDYGYLLNIPPGPHDADITPRSGSSGKDFNFNDKSFRLALAARRENFDMLAAYSYRSRGNYYSGKGGAKKYETDAWFAELTDSLSSTAGSGQIPISYVANYFQAGKEVANTSSELESKLLKGVLRLPHNQTLKLNYMHMNHTFGESVSYLVDYFVRNGREGQQGQWPYSNTKQDTFSLGYELKPEGNKWVNLDANIWMTKSNARRHQNGLGVYGLAANGVNGKVPDNAWDDYVRCHVRNAPPEHCVGVPNQVPEKLPNTDGRYNIIPAALQISKHDRWGVNVNNRFQLHPVFSLTAGGDFTRERLNQWDASGQNLVGGHEYSYGGNYLGPRSGRREQYNMQLIFDWAATSWLQISGGYRYSDYWAHDDLISRKRAAREPGWEAQRSQTANGVSVSYQEILSDAEAAALDQQGMAEWHEMYEMLQDYPEELNELLSWAPTPEAYADYDKINGVRYSQPNARESIDIRFPNVGTHKGFADANPFRNGAIDPDEQVDTAQSPTGKAKRYISLTSNRYSAIPVDMDPWQQPGKVRGHAWAPQLSASIFLTDSARVYARYSEFVRFPNLHEATQGAWGYGSQTTRATGPEHAYNWEIGYVQNLSSWLPNLQYADFRVNYFNNRIEDYIDRDYFFNIVQFKEKKLAGVELQGRFDTGKYHVNFGATYRLKQKLCDKDYASFLDPVYNRVPACVDGGFPQTFARTALQPQYSLNLDAGARLLENKLRISGRMTYHSAAKNKDEEKMNGASYLAFVRPFYWHPIWVFDASVNYAIDRNLSVDLTVNNLTNRYYVDPMARISMPAPGRTVTLGITAAF